MEEKKVGEQIEKRENEAKNKIFNWLKKPLNSSLALILIFSFAIRLYYFINAGGQPLWWDEAVYGSLAKNMISHQWGNTHMIIKETLIRPPLFPIFWAGLMLLKVPEISSKFILEFIPSIFSVFFIYLIGKETFNKRVGVVSALIFSLIPIFVFLNLRFLTDIPSLFFLISSIYFFIEAIKPNFGLNYKYFFISLFLLSISTLIRYPNGIAFFVFLAVLILSKKLMLKNQKFWIAGIIGVSPLLIFFLINLITNGNIFPAFLGDEYIKEEELAARPIAFYLLEVLPDHLDLIFLICFSIGFLLVLFNLFLGFNLSPKIPKIRNQFVLTLLFIFLYSFFIFYMRGGGPRHLLPIIISTSCFTGFGIDCIYKFAKKYNKLFAIFSILIILFAGSYFQIIHIDGFINEKKGSYVQFRQGFEWIKDNTPKESVLVGSGIAPYAIYYAERNYLTLPSDDEIAGYQNLTDADYIISHRFPPPQAPYITKYLIENEGNLESMTSFYLYPEKEAPVLSIFKRLK